MSLRNKIYEELNKTYPHGKLSTRLFQANCSHTGEQSLEVVYKEFVNAVINAAEKLVEKHTAPAPFPTDKLEFWEQCFMSSLEKGHTVDFADMLATDALLKRNNLIALLGEKNDNPST